MDAFYKKWKKSYDLAREYYRKNGTINVSRSVVYKDFALGQWVATQRSVYNGTRKGRLTERQINMLEKIEIKWWNEQPVENRKNARLISKQYMDAAKLYFEENNDLLIPANFIYNGLPIGNWLLDIKRFYKKVPIDVLENMPERANDYVSNPKLSAKNIIALNDMNIIWKEDNLDNWEYKYSLAKEFYEQNGHLRVRYGYVANDDKKTHLGEWIQYNRQLYSRVPCKLSKHKIDLLNKIGMIWDVYENLWEEKYEVAKEYYKEFGDLRVPRQLIYHNCNLGDWIDWQRQARKGNVRSALSQKRIDMLDKIGMVWAFYGKDKNEKKVS